jgi:hypothetical protein
MKIYVIIKHVTEYETVEAVCSSFEAAKNIVAELVLRDKTDIDIDRAEYQVIEALTDKKIDYFSPHAWFNSKGHRVKLKEHPGLKSRKEI